jgi:hypothetical protein
MTIDRCNTFARNRKRMLPVSLYACKYSIIFCLVVIIQSFPLRCVAFLLPIYTASCMPYLHNLNIYFLMQILRQSADLQPMHNQAFCAASNKGAFYGDFAHYRRGNFAMRLRKLLYLLTIFSGKPVDRFTREIGQKWA